MNLSLGVVGPAPLLLVIISGGLMPLFEYECQQCGHQFETLVTGSRKPACPKCKSEELEKRVSRVGMAGVSQGGWSRPSSGCGGTGGG